VDGDGDVVEPPEVRADARHILHDRKISVEMTSAMSGEQRRDR
jgi:hypothetical protein